MDSFSSLVISETILEMVYCLFRKEKMMVGALWGLFVVLLVLWLLGFVVFHVASGLIHILLILAVIVLVYNVIMASRARRL